MLAIFGIAVVLSAVIFSVLSWNIAMSLRHKIARMLSLLGVIVCFTAATQPWRDGEYYAVLTFIMIVSALGSLALFMKLISQR